MAARGMGIAASATGSVPERHSGEVITASPQAARTAAATRSSSAATTTRAARVQWRTVSRVWTTRGLPVSARRAFPGSRVEAIRAGMTISATAEERSLGHVPRLLVEELLAAPSLADPDARARGRLVDGEDEPLQVEVDVGDVPGRGVLPLAGEQEDGLVAVPAVDPHRPEGARRRFVRVHLDREPAEALLVEGGGEGQGVPIADDLPAVHAGPALRDQLALLRALADEGEGGHLARLGRGLELHPARLDARFGEGTQLRVGHGIRTAARRGGGARGGAAGGSREEGEDAEGEGGVRARGPARSMGPGANIGPGALPGEEIRRRPP